MAGKLYDTEEARIIDRVKAVAFREAMEAGANFINREWIAKKLHRSPRWVTDNWKKSYDECYTNFSDGPEEVLSQESKEIVEQATGKKRRSCREISKEILAKRQKKISHVSIHKVMLFFN